jgi:hypothetical protein
MVMEGLPRGEAAKKAGISDHGLYKALRNPPVLAYLRGQQEVLRTSAAAQGIAKAEKLMQSAVSEHVQADMTKFVLALDGIAPVAKAEIEHTHRHLLPGLTIITGGWQPHSDVQVLESHATPPGGLQKPRVNMVGTSRPHPLAPLADRDDE